MQRALVTTAVAAVILAGCSTPFRERRTPSGEFCSDMHVVPAGQVPDREYHRLQPIASDPEARTEAERLESLRKAACSVGADAVIEAVNEEIRAEDGRYASVASGTAVIWIRPTTGGATPLTLHPAKPPEPQPTTEPAAAPPPIEEPYDDLAPAASASAGRPPPKGPQGAGASSAKSPTAPASASSAKPGSSPASASSAKPGSSPASASSAKPGSSPSPGSSPPAKPISSLPTAKPAPAPKK